MRPGGLEVPINGDVLVHRQLTGAGGEYVVRTFPDSAEAESFDTRDEAVAAATTMAARTNVSVFYWEPPHAPTLLKPFRAL